MPSWSCPTCGRSFARANQNHSCKAAPSVDALFVGKPLGQRAAFDKIARALGKLGARVDPTASGVHFAAGSVFAAAKPKRDALRVEFFLARPLASRRVVKLEKLGPTRLAHHVDVASAGDVDAELLAWLKESCLLRSA